MARRTLERTTAPRFPEHPESEHRWRLDRVRRMMREDHLDAIMFSRNVNVFYMTGSRFVFVDRDGPTAGVPQTTAIVTRDADVYSQRFGPFDTEEVPLHTTWSQSLELHNDELELVDVLKHYGVARGARVGVEWGPSLCTGINPLKFQTLQRRIREELAAEIVDSTSTIWKVTAVKSPLEVERMKVAVAAAARAMDRIIKWVEIGMNELDVARMVQQFMLEEGADGVSHAQVMGLRDDGARFGSCNALDRRIERGWVNLDIGAKYKRYGSDINRGTFLGRGPTPDEQRLYECRIGANAVLDRVIKPGVSIDDAILAMKNYVEAQGCMIAENRGGLSGGHAIGLEHYQRPSLAPSSSMPELQNADGKVLFEPGMMFTYEMPVRLAGCSAAFNVEDDVVVTATGVENMSGMLSREMQVRL
ncbi:MAG: M24 family metallopeptidase [Armatimonadota bacterium]